MMFAPCRHEVSLHSSPPGGRKLIVKWSKSQENLDLINGTCITSLGSLVTRLSLRTVVLRTTLYCKTSVLLEYYSSNVLGSLVTRLSLRSFVVAILAIFAVL
jgi:hypothetical protein